MGDMIATLLQKRSQEKETKEGEGSTRQGRKKGDETKR